jgi:hypothetical protein
LDQKLANERVGVAQKYLKTGSSGSTISLVIALLILVQIIVVIMQNCSSQRNKRLY